jgi:hypothetical protein
MVKIRKTMDMLSKGNKTGEKTITVFQLGHLLEKDQ